MCVPLSELREQDLNVRYMKDAMFKQLVSNIRSRGNLESLPFCARVVEKIEIISGHHRARAAKAAGLKCGCVFTMASRLVSHFYSAAAFFLFFLSFFCLSALGSSGSLLEAGLLAAGRSTGTSGSPR